jgi:hypothetical protein
LAKEKMHLKIKTKNYFATQNRLIYNALAGSSSSVSKSAENANQTTEKISINTEQAPFIGNLETDLRTLASLVHPKEPEKQDNFISTLKTSIEKVLTEGLTIEAFWQKLKAEKNVTIEQISDGMIRFYSNEKPVSIGEYMKGFELKATTKPDHLHIENREKQNGQTRQDLAAFFGEIQGQLAGKLPAPPPPSFLA